MSKEEYSLRNSTKKVGELYPVIVAKNGDVVDGFHRRNAKANWRTEVREDLDTPEKVVMARLIANKFRRQVTADEVGGWVNDLAEIAVTIYGLKPGEISRWIADETGYSRDQVTNYLDDKYKRRDLATAKPGGRDDRGLDPIISEAEEALGPERYQELRKALVRDPVVQREALKEMQRPPITLEPGRDKEIKEAAKQLAGGIREGLRDLDRDIRKSEPTQKMRNNLSNLQALLSKQEAGHIYSPFNRDAVLIWDDGVTLQESVEEMKRRLEG